MNKPHYTKRIGNYVAELAHAYDHWAVKREGADEVLSEHNTLKEALAAIKRYAQADNRRN